MSSLNPVWNSPTPQYNSLNDVMSEELVGQLTNPSLETTEDTVSVDPLYDNDYVLAQALQKEFDLEHDERLKLMEKSVNRNAKVSLSFDNYRRVNKFDSDLPVEEEPDENFEIYNAQETRVASRPKTRGSGKEIITKHDKEICERRNVGKIEMFGPSFCVGDATGLDMRMSNKVFNELKAHNVKREARYARLHEKKENSTAEKAIDAKTRLLLFKWVDSGLLEDVGGVISTGKEASVYHAFGGRGTETVPDVPSECAIKIYKTTMNEFKTRSKYITGDIRFTHKFSTQTIRRVIKLWALKEHLNLKRLEAAGILCPKVIRLKKHVLLMSFIGLNTVPAPELRVAPLSEEDKQYAYESVLKIIRTMFHECRLIHADLSEYNLLWHNNEVYVIDVSQSVFVDHPLGLVFLYRDCSNISNFFSKIGVPNVLEAYEIFNELTGLNLTSDEKENQIILETSQFDKNEELITNDLARTHYPFDYFYNETLKEVSEDVDESCSSDEN